METSNNSTERPIWVQSTLFAEDSPVSPIVQPGSDSARKMTVTSGRRCARLYDKLPRAGSLEKTFVASLLGMKAWSSKKCLLTWQMRAIRRYRLSYFQLRALAPTTNDTGLGLLPTPNKSNASGGSGHNKDIQKQGNRIVRISQTSGNVFGAKLNRALSFMDANQMLPTPVVSNSTYQYSQRKDGSRVKVLTLIGKIRDSHMMPTPTNQDAKNSTLPPSLAGRDTVSGEACGWWDEWTTEPPILRVDDGLPYRLDPSTRNNRIGALGNAVVPQVVYQLFQAIQHIESQLQI